MFDEEEQWVIWNGNYGIVDTVTIKRVEVKENSKDAWLDVPYDIVGPFDFCELEKNGYIHFAACLIMSRRHWQQEQKSLREESLKKRRKLDEKMYEDINRFNNAKSKFSNNFDFFNETQCRQLLDLPKEGTLQLRQIKRAYRLIAKHAHPDVGGSHDRFIKITQARDVLMEIFPR